MPIRNPAIELRNWSGVAQPDVTVAGAPVQGARHGIHYNGGVRTLVAWLPIDIPAAPPLGTTITVPEPGPRAAAALSLLALAVLRRARRASAR